MKDSGSALPLPWCSVKEELSTPDLVEQWLMVNGLPDLSVMVEQERMDGEALLDTTPRAFNALPVDDQRRLVMAIAELRNLNSGTSFFYKQHS